MFHKIDRVSDTNLLIFFLDTYQKGNKNIRNYVVFKKYILDTWNGIIDGGRRERSPHYQK